MRIELGQYEQPGQAMFVHARRQPFVYLSLVLHGAAFIALYALGSHRIELEQRHKQEQLIDAGQRLTEQARLEKRVHDMARIKSLLEQSLAETSAHAAQAGADKDDEVQFSAPPRAPAELLKQARELSRRIDDIERDTRAEALTKLLKIPKKKALERLAEPPRAKAPPRAAAGPAPDPAAQIAQLEAKARAALARRRQQLEQQRIGTPVNASAARRGADRRPAGAGQGASASGNRMDGAAARGGQGHGGGGPPGSPVPDRIARFTNPDLPDRPTTAYLGRRLPGIFDRGIGHIPEVGPGAVVKGSGRIIGPGGAYANRVYVNRWYLIGPFEGRHGAALFANHRYPPEEAVALDAAYRGKGGRLLRWEYVDMASYPLIPPAQAEDAVYYGYTELKLDKAQDITIWVGADDDAQLWLNDSLVWRGGNLDKQWFFDAVYETENHDVRDYNLSEGRRVVHFRQGRNKLLFKLSNGPTRLFFFLVLSK